MNFNTEHPWNMPELNWPFGYLLCLGAMACIAIAHGDLLQTEELAVKSLLILTAGFGEGHNAAARNVREAVNFKSPETKVLVSDTFLEAYGWAQSDWSRKATSP